MWTTRRRNGGSRSWKPTGTGNKQCVWLDGLLCSIHVSCVLCPVSCIVCRVSCVMCHMLCIMCPVSCVVCPVSCVLCRVSCVDWRTLNVRSVILFEHSVVDTVRWSGVFDGTANLDDISYLPGRKTGVTFSTPEERVEVTNLARRMETIAKVNVNVFRRRYSWLILWINLVAARVRSKHAGPSRRRTVVLSTGHCPAEPGTDAAVQSGPADHLQHLPVLPQSTLHRLNNLVGKNIHGLLLQETFDNVSADVALARQENFVFGAKIVRGAYIVLVGDHTISVLLCASGCFHPVIGSLWIFSLCPLCCRNVKGPPNCGTPTRLIRPSRPPRQCIRKSSTICWKT